MKKKWEKKLHFTVVFFVSVNVIQKVVAFESMLLSKFKTSKKV